MNLLRIASRLVLKSKSNIYQIVTASENEKYVPNPFPSSKIQHPVYHGSHTKGITKFRRPDNGLWFSGVQGWVDDKYVDHAENLAK